MRHFIAIVHKDAGSAYGIQFPDVPGCFSAADDLDDLAAAASEAAPYVEGELSETFANIAGLHPAFVEWVEGRSNALGVAGNRSSTSSTASESSGTSTPTPDSTT